MHSSPKLLAALFTTLFACSACGEPDSNAPPPATGGNGGAAGNTGSQGGGSSGGDTNDAEVEPPEMTPDAGMDAGTGGASGGNGPTGGTGGAAGTGGTGGTGGSGGSGGVSGGGTGGQGGSGGGTATTPTARNDDYTVARGSSVSGNVFDNDDDVANATASAVTNPSYGTLTLDPDGSFTYTHDGSDNGPDGFMYYACIDTECDSAVVTFDVTGLSEPPTLGGLMAQTLDEDASVMFDVTLMDDDSDLDDLVVTVTAADDTLIPPSGIQVSGTGGTRTITLTPAMNAFGNTTVTVTITGGGAAVSETVNVTVNPRNDPPDVSDDDFTTAGNTLLEVGTTLVFPAIQYSGSLLDNDSDIDDDNSALTTSIVTGPTNEAQFGDVRLQPDGTFTYMPDVGYVGNDRFMVRVCDDSPTPGCRLSQVNIRVVKRVWYIADNASGGDGRSNAPFNNIANLLGASSTGDVLYVLRGSGTLGGQFVLKDDQVLAGQGAPLVIEAGVSLPSGATPILSSSTGYAVRLARRNTVQGVLIQSQLHGIQAANFTAPSYIDAEVRATGIALNVEDVGGNITVSKPMDGRIVIYSPATSQPNITFLDDVNISSSSGVGLDIRSDASAVPLANFTASLSVSTTTGAAIYGRGGRVAFQTANLETTNGEGLNLVNTNISGTAVGDFAHSDGPAVTIAGGTLGLTFSTLNIDNNLGAGVRLSSNMGTFQILNSGVGSNINTNNGPALDLNGARLGSQGLSFQSVSSDGGMMGIALTGVTGGTINVVGNGTPGSGGLIQNKTARGVNINSTPNVNLSYLTIEDAGTTDGASNCTVAANTGCNGAVFIGSSNNQRLRGITAIGGQTGCNVNGGSGIYIDDSTFTGQGDAPGESGIRLFGIEGAVNVTATTVTTSYHHAVDIRKNGGNMVFTGNGLTVAGSTAGDGVHYEPLGATRSELNCTGCNIGGTNRAFEVLSDGTSVTNVRVLGATTPSMVQYFWSCIASGSSSLFYEVAGGGSPSAPLLVGAGIGFCTPGGGASGALQGRFTGNHARVMGSGGTGFTMFSDGTASAVLEFLGNTIDFLASTENLLFLGTLSDGSMDATVAANDVTTPNNNNGVVVFQGGDSPAAACLIADANTVQGAGTFDDPISVINGTGTFTLPGVGASPSVADIQGFLFDANTLPGSAADIVVTGTGFDDGSACTTASPFSL